MLDLTPWQGLILSIVIGVLAYLLLDYTTNAYNKSEPNSTSQLIMGLLYSVNILAVCVAPISAAFCGYLVYTDKKRE